MNFEIVFATSNEHKLKEVREILCPHGIIVYGLKDLNIDISDVIENGKTYYENALIKAEAVKRFTSFPIIADDSGLEISALNNIPGLYSARFAKEKGGHKKACEYLLKELEGKDKSAKFVCYIVLLNVEKKPLKFIGEAKGTFVKYTKGENGFGYDPSFYSFDLNKTFADASEEEKNIYSHRAKALQKLLIFLKINKFINK